MQQKTFFDFRDTRKEDTVEMKKAPFGAFYDETEHIL